MDFFDGLFVTLACPNCNYGIDVELRSGSGNLNRGISGIAA